MTQRCTSDLYEKLIWPRLRNGFLLDNYFLLLLRWRSSVHCCAKEYKRLTGSQAPAFIVPEPSAGLKVVLPVLGERCALALAASSTDADIVTAFYVDDKSAMIVSSAMMVLFSVE